MDWLRLAEPRGFRHFGSSQAKALRPVAASCRSPKIGSVHAIIFLRAGAAHRGYRSDTLSLAGLLLHVVQVVRSMIVSRGTNFSGAYIYRRLLFPPVSKVLSLGRGRWSRRRATCRCARSSYAYLTARRFQPHRTQGLKLLHDSALAGKLQVRSRLCRASGP
jgi:hypothetical protein